MVALLVGHELALDAHVGVYELDHLRRAGLGAGHHVGTVERLARAALDRGDHGVEDELAVALLERQQGVHLGLLGFHQLRLAQLAVADQGREIARDLQRRSEHVALADGGDDGLAPGPGRAETLALPFLGRDEPGLLVGQVDARARAETAGQGVLVEVVNAHLVAELVEIHVAGVHQGVFHGQRAEPGLLPVVEFPVADLVRRRAAHDVARFDEVAGKPGRGHEQLEHRPGRIHALGDAVLDGMARVVAQFLPFVGRHAEHEHVVVVARFADHGPYLARVGLHDDDGPGLALEELGALALEVDVDGQAHVAAGLGRLQDLLVVLAAEGVHLDLLAALGPAQLVLQGVLQALLAHGVAEREVRALFQLLLVGLGHVAEHVGHERAGGVGALLADDDLEARIEHGVGLDVGQGLVGEVGDERERLEGFDPLLAAAKGLEQLRLVHAGPLRDLGQGGVHVGAVLAHEAQGEGGLGNGEGHAVDVHDPAPGGVDAHLAQLVVPGHFRELGALVHLQIPQAQGEQAEEPEHEHLEQDEPGTGGVLLRGFGFKPHARCPAGSGG
ncbi:hypothetical protein DSECCO2_664700 [anaerobic digester metagenome]